MGWAGGSEKEGEGPGDRTVKKEGKVEGKGAARGEWKGRQWQGIVEGKR